MNAYHEYYHQCGIAGGNRATSSSDINLLSATGKYHISEFAKSFDGTNSYTIRNIPKVTAVSHHELSTATGSIITISGEGFSPITSENTVDVGGNACLALEASETDITCQVTISNSDYSGTIDFVGGLGANVVEYEDIVNSEITIDHTPVHKHLSDFTVRTGVNEGKLTRTVEAWFIPPQSGDYIFHGS